MKKVMLVLFLSLGFLSFGQETQKTKEVETVKKKSDFWKNVRVGGGFGLNFGNNVTTIAVNPTAVYDFNQKFSLGGSLGYTYSKSGDFKSNVFTASVLSIYAPFQNFEFSGELEQLFVNSRFGDARDSYNYPALYLGVAYRTRNFSIGGRFDVLYNDDKSIYSSPFTPFVRVFF